MSLQPEILETFLQLPIPSGESKEKKIRNVKDNPYYSGSKSTIKSVFKYEKEESNNKDSMLGCLTGLKSCSYRGTSDAVEHFAKMPMASTNVNDDRLPINDITRQIRKDKHKYTFKDMIASEKEGISHVKGNQNPRVNLSKRMRTLSYDCISYHCKGLEGVVRNWCIIKQCNRQ